MTDDQKDDANQVARLMQHPAFGDPSHPEHAHISSLVKDYFAGGPAGYPYPPGVQPDAPLDS